MGGLAPLAVGRARRRLPPRRRAALRPLALHARRGHHAQPVEDRASGRDRRRSRDDRLPTLQRRVHAPDLRGAAELLAGVHFTGSTPVFQGMWKTIGENIANYRNYPRIVGETGGKDFIVAHPSADVDEVATAIVRGSFEYQGQKCSAASRVYAPKSMWPELRERLEAQVGELKMGDVSDFSNFMGAVIDGSSFATQKEAIDEARASANAEIVAGGG